MAWHELELVLPRQDLDRVGALLFDLGASGVQEDFLPGEAPPPRQPWDTGPPPPAPARKVLRAWLEAPDKQAVADALRGIRVDAALRWSDVPDTDWDQQWRDGFAPIHVSDRLIVAPPWDAPEGAVIIEPGQGFGTGAHPTTLAALHALDDLADEVSTVLDVGCGSGILAIAAARLGLSARGIDVDEAAIRDAETQAARNGVVVPFSTTPVGDVDTPADLVLANLYAEVLRDMAPDLVRLTGRHLVLAGVLADREALVRDVLDDALTLTGRERDGEWVSLRYTAEVPSGGAR